MNDKKGRTDAGHPASGAPASEVDTPNVPPRVPPEVVDSDGSTNQAWNTQVRKRMQHHTRRGFLGLGLGLAAGLGSFAWLTSRREVDGLPWPFRKVLEVNEQIARDYFSRRRSSREVARDRVGADWVNGDLGLDEDFDIAKWKLEVYGIASEDTPLQLGLEDIRKLPHVRMTTEFKCIEGWSYIVEWGGVRFADFMKAYPPETISGDPFSVDHPEDLPPYVSMATPDGGYYVGLDMESLMHAQTLLVYEMNGSPLSSEHGAPLRLAIPVKYGIKNIKRIGSIRYSTLRPADYWAERGYDWYAGL